MKQEGFHVWIILVDRITIQRNQTLLLNKPRGVPWVDDSLTAGDCTAICRECRVLSGIVFCLQRGYLWSDVPSEYGPAKTLYNRYKRWSEAGILEHIFNILAQENADLRTLMLDATHVKTHRIAANGSKKTPTKGGRAG